MDDIFDVYFTDYLMVVEEPELHGYTHEYIKCVLDSRQFSDSMANLFMCDEKVILTEKTRTYIYVSFRYHTPRNALVLLFPFARVVPVRCSGYEVRNYLLKERNYKPIRVFVEPFPETFEEWTYAPGVKGGVRRE